EGIELSRADGLGYQTKKGQAVHFESQWGAPTERMRVALAIILHHHFHAVFSNAPPDKKTPFHKMPLEGRGCSCEPVPSLKYQSHVRGIISNLFWRTGRRFS